MSNLTCKVTKKYAYVQKIFKKNIFFLQKFAYMKKMLYLCSSNCEMTIIEQILTQ